MINYLLIELINKLIITINKTIKLIEEIMPKEETIELRHIRNVIGEKEDLPKQNPRTSLSSRIRTLLLRTIGVPHLIHLYGALEPNKVLTLDNDEGNIWVIFSDGTYMYAGLDASPAKVVKIDLSTFTKVSTITLSTGENAIRSMCSDGTYLYVGTLTDPGKIIRINLSTFTKTSTLTLQSGVEYNIRSLFSDGTYLYAGCATPFDVRIVRINLITFTKVDTMNTGGVTEFNVCALFSDSNYLYAGLDMNPGKIVRIDLSTFTKVDTLTLSKNGIGAMFSDGTYLYASAVTYIVKIDLSTFTETNTLSISYAQFIYSLFSDGTYLYAGVANVDPSKIVKINLISFTIESTITLENGLYQVYTLFSDGTYLYIGLNWSPGKIVRYYIIPTSDLHRKQIDLINEHIHTGVYNLYPTLSDGIVVTSGAGIYAMGAYVEIIPSNTIKTTFYMTNIFLNRVSTNAGFETEIAKGDAGSESKIATVFIRTSDTTCSNLCSLPIPIKIPSNTRISARCADSVGSSTIRVRIHYKT